jgi:hypothetical protein
MPSKTTVNRKKVLKQLHIPETPFEENIRQIGSNIINDLLSPSFHSMLGIIADIDKEGKISFKFYYNDIMTIETLLSVASEQLFIHPNQRDYEEEDL